MSEEWTFTVVEFSVFVVVVVVVRSLCIHGQGDLTAFHWISPVENI